MCSALLSAMPTSLNDNALTTTVLYVRHLAARHNVSLRIFDNLGRCQRRRLRGDCYCVHGADWERVCNRSCAPLHAVRERGHPRCSPATEAQVVGESCLRDAQRQRGVVLGLWQWACMYQSRSADAPLADLPLLSSRFARSRPKLQMSNFATYECLWISQ